MPRLSRRQWILVVLLLVTLVGIGYLMKAYGSNYLDDRKYVHYVLRSWWQSKQAAFSNGYTDQIAYDKGDTLRLYTDYSGKRPQKIYVFNILGERVDSLEVSGMEQKRPSNPAVEGYGYSVSASYPIPDLQAGLYTWEQTSPFLIRGEKSAPISVLYPANTIQAYNISGGKSFYSLFSDASDTISFLRPTFPAISFMVRPIMEWLFQRNLSLRYLSDIDLEGTHSLDSTHLLLIIGHSEYWSASARNTFDRFIKRGGNALILSGNTMWWKVRYLPESAQLICFKDAKDPQKGIDQTGNWHDHFKQGPGTSIGVSFQQGGYGRKFGFSQGGFTLYDTSYVLFREISFGGRPFIEVPTKEYDGQHLLKKGNQYVLDSTKASFFRYRILGHDFASHGYERGTAPLILFQKTETSGTILNVSSTDWCSYYGFGGQDKEKIEEITRKAIELLSDHTKTARLWE